MKQISKQDLKKLSHHKQILFACFCAEQVLHLVKEEHKSICLRAIQMAYLFLEGKAPKEECYAAADAAYAAAYAAADAAYAAAYAAADAAADAAYAAAAADAANAAANAAAYAADAANAAANAADAADAANLPIIEAQWALYDQLLNGDKYFEEIVLGKV